METSVMQEEKEKLKKSRQPLATPTDLEKKGLDEIYQAMNVILADVFALFVKTKNFHWHMSGTHFRDYHLLLDEQSEQLFAMTDPIAERVRKLGGTTITSTGHIASLQRVKNNDEDFVAPTDMLSELCNDNKEMAAHLRDAHEICDNHNDVGTASMLEEWIDETERRTWFLFESVQEASQ